MKRRNAALLISLFVLGCGDDGGSSAGDPDAGGGADAAGGGTDGGADPDGGAAGGSVTVPAGAFMMGCNEAMDEDCGDDELPYHEVTLSAFEIDVTEVTQGAYAACVEDGACGDPEVSDEPQNQIPFDPETYPSHPVTNVTWDQAAAYCQWAGQRLPTEAEWEKAARGDDGRLFPWGNQEADCDRAVMNELFGGDDGCDTGGTLPVGSRPDAASPYGALDMAGNAEEWVADFYAPDYYGESPSSDPTGPSDGAGRSVRGGSFHSIAPYLRTSRRRGSLPEHADSGRGFRCARSL